MADRFVVEVTSGDLVARLERAAAQVQRPLELMQLVGATLESNIALRFISKIDPAGHAWLPLAPSTLKRKKGKGSILEHFGLGKKSLTSNATDAFVEIGFGEPYMGFHETGTQRMPRRQLLTDDWLSGTLGAQDQQDVLDDVEDWLAGLGLV